MNAICIIVFYFMDGEHNLNISRKFQLQSLFWVR